MELENFILVDKNRLERIEFLLEQLVNNKTIISNNQIDKTTYTDDEVCEVLSIKKTTLYSWRCKGKIPCYQIEGSCKYYYDKKEIENFMKTIKHKSNLEIEREADSYIATHPVKKGRK